MEKQVHSDIKIMWIMKALLVSYILTGILLLLLTLLLYKMNPDEKLVSAMIVSIYVVSTLIGGILIGKMAKTRRFLWGVTLGIVYFALLLMITLGVYRTIQGDSVSVLTTMLLCAGGGMAGGMIS